VRTVFILSVYIVGYLSRTASTSYKGGSLARISWQDFSIVSSRVRPPVPVALSLGCNDSSVLNTSYDSFWSHVISAFSWRPNISGFGASGSSLMYAAKALTFVASGIIYTPDSLKLCFVSTMIWISAKKINLMMILLCYLQG
jgi:hypothetical protein